MNINIIALKIVFDDIIFTMIIHYFISVLSKDNFSR